MSSGALLLCSLLSAVRTSLYAVWFVFLSVAVGCCIPGNAVMLTVLAAVGYRMLGNAGRSVVLVVLVLEVAVQTYLASVGRFSGHVSCA